MKVDSQPSIYLDNAATTQVAAEVLEIMVACMREDFGNPSSAHRMGIAASRRLKEARETFLDVIGDERGGLGDVIWTSGGTESDALGISGAARALSGRGRHIVATAIEHPAVLGALTSLEHEGFSATVVPVTSHGLVEPEAVARAVRDDTVVVACMLVNNELGTIQPVAEIAAAVKAQKIHVHCDAAQALGKIPVDVRALGVDSVAFAGHKLHAPKGVGALWVRTGTRLAPLWAGGGQQKGLRSGTENVPGIAGLAAAARLSATNLKGDMARIAELRERLVAEVMGAGLGVRLSTGPARCVPHIVSLGFPGLEAEPLLHALEPRGIYVSAGSACASSSHGKSHVLKAIGLGDHVGTLRISFSRMTSSDEVATCARVLAEEAQKLRM